MQELLAGTAPFEFVASKHTSKTRQRPGPMATSYIAHILSATFGGAIRYAVAEQWIGRSPLTNVELPRDDTDIDDDLPHLTYLEVETAADEAAALTGRNVDRVLLHTLAYCGPRIGEATALKIKDLDLDRKRARVMRTWTIDRDGKRKIGPAKTWEKRWVPLTSFVVTGLRDITKSRDADDWVFTSVRGEAIDGKNWYNRVWLRARANTGLPDHISVHDLRHVAATLAIGAGADVKLVQQMLGHKDATETLNTYAHLWPDRMHEVVSLVEERRLRALDEAA